VVLEVVGNWCGNLNSLGKDHKQGTTLVQAVCIDMESANVIGEIAGQIGRNLCLTCAADRNFLTCVGNL
jgi:hypothetical protein